MQRGRRSDDSLGRGSSLGPAGRSRLHHRLLLHRRADAARNGATSTGEIRRARGVISFLASQNAKLSVPLASAQPFVAALEPPRNVVLVPAREPALARAAR